MADKQYTTIIKTFEYKLRTNQKFVAACEKTLEDARQIYNAALKERIDCYRMTGKSLGYVEQSRHLTDARELPHVKTCLRSIQQDALEKLDFAFKAFFLRPNAGFPRFKGKDRYHTFSQKIEKQRACPLQGDKLTVPGVGTCRVRLSRELPEGSTVKQLRITRRASGWFALLVIEAPKRNPLPKTGLSVGVDVGVKDFCTLSTGEVVANPRTLQKHGENLAQEQRRLARKKKGSNNRQKAKLKVARVYAKVANTRKDFHHKLSTSLVQRFDVIAVEALNVKGMVRNHKLSKSILDVAWSAFFAMIQTKAENAGRVFEKVNPAYTSQTCSECGHRQKMPLKVRTFECGKCQVVIQRDHNAAINILGRGTAKVTLGEIRDSASVNQEQVLISGQIRESGRFELPASHA